MLGSGVKRRVVNPFQKLVLNPLVKAAFELGIPPPGDALLETIGRRSGQARSTPVCDGPGGRHAVGNRPTRTHGRLRKKP